MLKKEKDGELQLPNIPIKIVRLGDKLKLTAGVHTLELKELPGSSQNYSLLVLDKFITEVTTVELQKHIVMRRDSEDFRNQVLGNSEEVTDQRIVDLLIKESGDSE